MLYDAGPSKAQVVLAAVELASESNVQGLQRLATRHLESLELGLLLRIILTYLPETLEPSSYTSFLTDIASSHISETNSPSEEETLYANCSEDQARKKVNKLYLLPLAEPSLSYDSSLDIFTLFLLHRAYRVEAETGNLPVLKELLEPFIGHSEYLRAWFTSILLPLLRLDFEYHPDRDSALTLHKVDKLEGRSGVNLLLSKAAQKSQESENEAIVRDLRGIIGPWIYGKHGRKRQRLEDKKEQGSIIKNAEQDNIYDTSEVQENVAWEHVFGWIVDLALRDFSSAADVIEQWGGAEDIDYGGWDKKIAILHDEQHQASIMRYAQAGIAAVYATKENSLKCFERSYRLLERVCQLVGLSGPPNLMSSDQAPEIEAPHQQYLRSLSRIDSLHNELLRFHNPLTTPSGSSILLLYLVIMSACTLESLGHPLMCRTIAELAIFGNEEDQRGCLHKILHGSQIARYREDEAWIAIRTRILWLRSWNSKVGRFGDNDAETHLGLFCSIREESLEIEILRAFLAAAQYQLAVKTYCQSTMPPLAFGLVEKVVLEVALSLYDNASNGNKMRGGIKRVAEIVTAFQVYFRGSQSFAELEALVSATHALSYYSLTLQHGVPFRPVNIRIHEDPVALIGKIFDQNPRSYTKLDDLIEIGRNFISAGLIKSPKGAAMSPSVSDRQSQVLLLERRITAIAIEAALAEDDFDTAYSYVVTRLSSYSDESDRASGSSKQRIALEDDISWRAACQAGRHRSGKSTGTSDLRRFEQRMELLSQSLLLAPSSALSEVLGVWQNCEDDMNVLLKQETEEEENWDSRGDQMVPGGFDREPIPDLQKPRESTRGAMNEEAPMGLFDVARGAASALSRSAFPLRNTEGRVRIAPGKVMRERPLSAVNNGESDQGSISSREGLEGRVRKRDIVSNMVTGGLASGIGWVIGVPTPTAQQE